MKRYVKPSIKAVLMPELLQGLYGESTPEAQLSKSAANNFDEQEEPGEPSVWD